MALDLVNYVNAVKNPSDAVMEGFTFGANISKIQAERRAAEIKAKLTQQAIDEQKAMNADLEELYSKAKTGALAPDDFTSISFKYPKLSEHFKRSYDIWNEDQKNEAKKESIALLTAIENKDTESAKKLLRNRIEAEGEADTPEKIVAESMLKTLDIDPDISKVSVAMQLHELMGGKDFADTWNQIQERIKEIEGRPLDIKKEAADIGLTEAQTEQALANAKNLSSSAQKTLLELEMIEKGELIPEQERKQNELKMKLEDKLRDDFTNVTKNYQLMRQSNAAIQQASPDSVGDILLVTSFMKMIDSGSTVREAEYATALKAGSFFEQIISWFKRPEEGKVLGTELRTKIKKESQKVLDEAQKIDSEVRANVSKIVKARGLNQDAVFLTNQSPLSDKNKTETTEEKPSYLEELGL